LATLWRSSRSPPEPCLWRRQQEEFVAWSEKVSFFLEEAVNPESAKDSVRYRPVWRLCARHLAVFVHPLVPQSRSISPD
jgi:hypothetical protein